MFLPWKFFKKSCQKASGDTEFMACRRKRLESENNKLRLRFLRNCQMSDIIPRFLKFRVPLNGCFEERNVQKFQRKLLRKEIVEAARNLENQQAELVGISKKIVDLIPSKWVLKVSPELTWKCRDCRKQLNRTHRNIKEVSEKQQKPSRRVEGAVLVNENLNIRQINC